MKIIFGSFIFLSSLFSAQTSLIEPLKRDSIDLNKFNVPIVSEAKQVTIDNTITKLYKMPIAKPKDSSIYSSLKAPAKINSQYKIINALEPLKTKKLAGK